MLAKIKNWLIKVKLFFIRTADVGLFLSSVSMVLVICHLLVFSFPAMPLSGLATTIIVVICLIQFFVIFLSAYSVFFGLEDRPFFIFYFFTGLIGLAMVLISSFAWLYRAYGLYDVNGNIVKDSASALYFSIVTWTTLGYGDFRPTEEIRLLAATEALLGYVYTALLIGIFLWLLTTFSKIGKNQNNK